MTSTEKAYTIIGLQLVQIGTLLQHYALDSTAIRGPSEHRELHQELECILRTLEDPYRLPQD
jgi:hypothetical protein